MKIYFYLVLLFLGCTQIESFLPETPKVVWQSKNHIAFPSVEKLNNGEIVCVFRHGAGHVSPDGTILLCRSFDHGKSWSPPDTIINTRWDARDPSITELSDGTLLLNFFQSRYDSSGKIIGPVGIFTARSLDGGQSWFSPKMVILEEYDWTAISSKIIELKNGQLLMPIYAGNVDERSKAIVVISQDMGKTWESKYVMAYDSTGYIDYQEPALMELLDGRVLCILRTSGDVHFQHKSYSGDGGKTWGPPTRTNLQGQAAGLLLTQDNILVCGYRDFSPKATSYATSYDNGQTFEDETIISLFDRDRAYPEIIEIEDKILSVHYEAQKGESKILATFLNVGRLTPPAGLSISQNQDSTVSLKWKAVTNAHYYTVYRSLSDSNNVEINLENIATVDKNYYNDKATGPGNSYIYRIKAIVSQSELIENSGAESTLSGPVDIQL